MPVEQIFKVDVIQTYTNEIEIKAKSRSEAVAKASSYYENSKDGEFACDANNYTGTKFHVK